jgi:hypothetical protein
MAEPLVSEVSEYAVTQAKLGGVMLPSVLFDMNDIAYVYSLYWMESPINGQYQFGPFKMPGCPRNPKDLKPVKKAVYGTIIGIDRGNGQLDPQKDSAKAWAKSVANGHEQFGVFVSAGDEPTQAELQAALARLESYYRSRLERAEDIWARTGSRKGIEWVDRLAAQYFGLVKEWGHDRSQDSTCPACKKSVAADAIKHDIPSCGAILDWERAREFGMLTEFQEANAISLGKLKPLMARKPEPRA